ncbi:MAG TPA: VCBS repeat-containing protein, partial [Xanthobacteraceae bacterium]|nr:VCBS repeat-containing protein [Xanthobacteraceae bacterium]
MFQLRRCGGDAALFRLLRLVLIAASVLVLLSANLQAQNVTTAYGVLSQRVGADQSQFFVYQDADSGFNHGFASGVFGTQQVSINAACIDDTSAAQGCSTNSAQLDEIHGTVLQLAFPVMTAADFAGLNVDEPLLYYDCATTPSDCGTGYNLTGATSILFSVRSPTGITVQFGAGSQNTPWVTIPVSSTYATACIALGGSIQQDCPPTATYQLALGGSISLSSVHILFTVVSNGQMAPNGGVLLLDNIQYGPVPTAQTSALSLPLSTQTFGVLPSQQTPIPPDQANRNPATTYEAALSIMALLARGTPTDIANAELVANALVYALGHDNSGDPLPVAGDGSTGLHSAYEAGDIALFNSQGSGGAQAGQIRLAGFSVTSNICGASGYCLVEDGATGGNNALAMVALLKIYRQTANQSYLNAALTIGSWIYQQLLDTSGTGFGGYFAGYPDQGSTPKVLENGKSTENNADIFAAFTALAEVENGLGNFAAASTWTSRAQIAGDFAIAMFNTSSGCLSAGTVAVGTPASFGTAPTGPTRGNDVINQYDFFDANSFTWLALAHSRRYAAAIPWSSVVSCLSQFQTSVSAAATTFTGYSLVQSTGGPQGTGVAWEFTGQAAVVLALSGGNPTSVLTNIANAQTAAPFGDQNGLVAATLASGDTLPPDEQCLNTPFQCIPERVGIAATAWAIFAASAYNPLATNTLWTDTHDFNGDGYADILWRDTSGNMALWEMNGGTVINANSAGLGGVATTWSIVGQRDFNGDGNADMLWHDSSGDLAIWEMSGTTILNPNNSGLGSVPTAWSIVGTGDFNGDGYADILWRNTTTGDVAIWEMNGTTILNPS